MALPATRFRDSYQLILFSLDFMRLLWSVQHALQRLSKRMEKKSGVTGPQRLVLRIVAQYPGVSAGELAHILRLHPSTLTGILQRLVSRGLLIRHTDPVDKRRIRLRVTLRARASILRKTGTIEQAVTDALSRITPTKLDGARDVHGGDRGNPGTRPEQKREPSGANVPKLHTLSQSV